MTSMPAYIELLGAVRWEVDRAAPVLLGAAGLLVLVALLYRRQARALPGRWRWLLPALRVLALVALVISIARPVLTRPREAEERGTILVLVDRSLSMSVADMTPATDAGRAQLVALADLLGRLPPAARAGAGQVSDEAHALLAAADEATTARNELDFARMSGRTTKQAEQRLAAALANLQQAALRAGEKSADLGNVRKQLQSLANSVERARQNPDVPKFAAEARKWADAMLNSQMSFDLRLYQRDEQVRQICDELSKLTRIQVVEQALLAPKRGLVARLKPGSPLVAMSFAAETEPISIGSAGEPALAAGLSADGRRTNLVGALRQAIERVGESNLEAVVLISGPFAAWCRGFR